MGLLKCNFVHKILVYFSTSNSLTWFENYVIVVHSSAQN